MKDDWKLFIWRDVLHSALPGLMFAMARNVDDARRDILRNESVKCPSVAHIVEAELGRVEPEVYDVTHGEAVWGSA